MVEENAEGRSRRHSGVLPWRLPVALVIMTLEDRRESIPLAQQITLERVVVSVALVPSPTRLWRALRPGARDPPWRRHRIRY